MRKSLAVAISCVVLLAWWFCQNLHVKAQGGAGAQCATEFSADANGDGTVDISDPVWILNWLFTGGPPPCAQAKSCDICLTPEQAQMLEQIAFGRKIAGTWFHYSPNKAFLSISADGVITADGTDGVESTLYPFAQIYRGTWTQTGPQQIKFRGARMVFHEDGTPWLVQEILTDATFDEGFNNMSGIATFKSCLWQGWEPDNCMFAGSEPYAWSAKRVPIE